MLLLLLFLLLLFIIILVFVHALYFCTDFVMELTATERPVTTPYARAEQLQLLDMGMFT